MRLADMTIENFRSIEHAVLAECGHLNVLIGKNNSGKSNALLAIDNFFRFISSGRGVAIHEPPVRAAADWFRADSGRFVKFVATLQLSDEEEEVLREQIATEAPQVRHALDDIPRTGLVQCELSFTQWPTLLGYVSKISFKGHDPTRDFQHCIFRMRTGAAQEIAERDTRMQSIRSQVDALQNLLSNLDADDWRMARERGGVNFLTTRFMRAPGAQGMLPDIHKELNDSNSHGEFETAIRERIDLLESEARVLQGTPNQNRVETFSGDSELVPHYVSDFIHTVGALKFHRLTENRAPIGQSEAGKVLQLKMSRGQGEKLRDLQWTVRNLLGVEVDAFASEQQRPPRREFGPRDSGLPVRAELDVDDFLVQVNGSGIRQSLRLMLDYEFERPDILLIEEPEVYLHPALEIAVLQYLKSISNDCQIFLTTHSTNFLDTAEFKNVYLTTRSHSTGIQLLRMEEAEEAVPEELGIRLSSLFMYDRLVFVEGTSDEQVLRELAKKLGINLAQHGVGFITTGGSRNFTHYATASTLSFLSKRRVSLTFILDRDERSVEDDERLRSQVGHFGTVHTLQRRELENYLISTKGICDFVANRNGGVARPDESDLEAAVQEVAESLREEAIQRRVVAKLCLPIVPERGILAADEMADLAETIGAELGRLRAVLDTRESRVISEIEETTDEVGSDWDSRKLELVPGDELLSSLLKRYGIRFRKSRDAAELARCLPIEDIPSEIRELFDKVTADF